jgi:hypothetical protein
VRDDSAPELPFDNNRPTSSSLTGIVNYLDWARIRFPRSRQPRSLKDAIAKFDLPVTRIGHSLLIDVELGDQRLREIAAEQMAAAKAQALAAQEPQQTEPEARRPGRQPHEIEVPPRRGRGRPKGSKNKLRPPLEDAPKLDGPNEPGEPVKEAALEEF